MNLLLHSLILQFVDSGANRWNDMCLRISDEVVWEYEQSGKWEAAVKQSIKREKVTDKSQEKGLRDGGENGWPSQRNVLMDCDYAEVTENPSSTLRGVPFLPKNWANPSPSWRRKYLHADVDWCGSKDK